MTFVEGVAQLLVASGLGTSGATATGLYSTSGTSVQVTERRDFGTPIVVLLQETGGLAFPFDVKEQQGFQVLIDASTISGARAKAFEIYEFLHDQIKLVVSGGAALWVRATTMPQAIPVGPGAGEAARHQFSVNFDALIVKEF